MKSFKRIINKFIKDNSPDNLSLSEHQKVKNTLRTEEVLTPTLVTGDGIFGSYYECPLGLRHDNLAQLVLEVDITISEHAGELAVEDYLGAQICKKIVFGTRTLPMHTLYPEIISQKVDALFNSDLFPILQRGLQGTGIGPSNVNPETFSLAIPLFFFFSEEGGRNFLDCKNTEEFYLSFYTADNLDILGMYSFVEDYSITALKFRVRRRTHDVPEETANSYLSGFKRVPRQIKGSYDYFREPILTLTQGQATATILMSCPYAISKTIYCVVSNFGDLKNVISVSTDLDGDRYKTEHFLTNYSLYAEKNTPYLPDQYFTEELSILQNVNKMSGLLTYSGGDSMYPCYKTVTFDATPATSEVFSLIVYHEYYTTFNVNEYGIVSNTTQSMGVKNF